MEVLTGLVLGLDSVWGDVGISAGGEEIAGGEGMKEKEREILELMRCYNGGVCTYICRGSGI